MRGMDACLHGVSLAGNHVCGYSRGSIGSGHVKIQHCLENFFLVLVSIFSFSLSFFKDPKVLTETDRKKG